MLYPIPDIVSYSQSIRSSGYVNLQGVDQVSEYERLNLGFTSYLEALTLEFLSDTPGEWSSWKDYTRGAVTSEPNGSIWVDDTTDVARIFNY